MKRVVLCDDHQIVLDGLTAALSGVDTMQLEGAFLTSKELLEHLHANPVDLAVLDINLADIDGVALAKHLKRTWPKLAVMARVLRGQKALSADLAGFLVDELQSTRTSDLLTRGEHEVLRLVCEGQLNKQIAATLGVSVTTVERRRASVMRKSGSRSAAELSLWAAKTPRS